MARMPTLTGELVRSLGIKCVLEELIEEIETGLFIPPYITKLSEDLKQALDTYNSRYTKENE